MIKRIYKNLFSEKLRVKIRIYLNILISPFYSGDQFYCNCCQKSFRKFLSKGNVERKNAQCPYCGSLERTRVLALYLRNETGIFTMKSPRILHIAPEYSLFRILKKLDAEYVDGDIDPAYARNVVDITDIHFPDNYFDLIICSHVLGHVPDEGKAVKELCRVLAPGGEAIIMTVLDLDSPVTLEDSRILEPEDRLARYGESDLCRLHGMDFQDRLEAGGFKVKPIDYRTHFTAAENARFRLGDGKRELIFSCEK